VAFERQKDYVLGKLIAVEWMNRHPIMPDYETEKNISI
jgi:hypothetical protein